MRRKEHRRNDDYWGWRTAKRIDVKDGIRAKIRPGGSASSWWGTRWIEVLKGFGWENRLTRGRTYARKGQVVDLTIGSEGAAAGVQGSEPRPYRVKIRLEPLTGAQWNEAVAALVEEPLFVGKLLVGEMPDGIEAVFRSAGAPLFPQRSRDLKMSCSCPDSAVPCKHIAAVYYILAEWLDNDPFVLFELRGRDRDTLLAALRERRIDESETVEAPLPDEPLSPESFWIGGEIDREAVSEASPAVRQAILRALGDPPGWSGDSLATLLGPVYAAVAERTEAARDTAPAVDAGPERSAIR